MFENGGRPKASSHASSSGLAKAEADSGAFIVAFLHDKLREF
jgi:hypothetical protein